MTTEDYQKLKEDVCRANKQLLEHRLVLFTWGNVSAIDRNRGTIAIKPSGVEYAQLKPSDIVILDLEGNIIEGQLRPSSDTPTHIEIYKQFTEVGAVVHTHSTYATAFAQARQPIECLGTTHADHFYGSIPVTREMTEQEVGGQYEKNTGLVIIEHFKEHKIDPMQMQACIIASHGPFVWGKTLEKATYNAVVLEEIARMNILTMQINRDVRPVNKYLLDKHYLRKHGKDAYYGQKK
jgi:L-ribulose-5-phosphate 4-epimerase